MKTHLVNAYFLVHPDESTYTACGILGYTDLWPSTADPAEVTCKNCIKMMARIGAELPINHTSKEELKRRK